MPVVKNVKETAEKVITGEVKKERRKRRTREEIESDKAAKAAEKLVRQAEREAKKAEKETAKATGKKGNGQKTIMPDGGWNDPSESITMDSIKVEIRLMDSSLGLNPSDKNLLSRYIASKAPDAPSREEEIAAYGEDEVIQKATTIFPRGYFEVSENGQHLIDSLWRKAGGRGYVDPKVDERHPFFWNYQIRGFFKDSCGLLSKAAYGRSAETTAYKKVIDGGIFVEPRRVAITLPEVWIDDDGEDITPDDFDKLPVLERRIKRPSPTGEQVALASSEIIPAGSTMKFAIRFTDPKSRELVYEWLNYGTEHGLGAWRNSGRGVFQWRLLNDDWSPRT